MSPAAGRMAAMKLLRRRGSFTDRGMAVTQTKGGTRGNPAGRRVVLLWLVPVVVLIHNVEQALTIEQTMALTRTGMPRALRLIVPPVPPVEYIAALVIATLAAFGCALWGKLDRDRGPGVYLLASIQTALLLNIGAHVAASLVTASYTAGLGTSIALVLPFSLVFFWSLIRERWVPVRALPLLLLGGIALHLPIFFGILFLAGQIPLPGR